MAKFNNNTLIMTLKLALVLFSVCLMISMTESRHIAKSEDAKSAPVCNLVIGTEAGDTCSDIANSFNLSPEEFGAINPNINCDDIFVGQWLCVDGSVN